MGFLRALVSKDAKIPQPMRAGAGLLANFIPDNRAAETDETLTAAQVSGGLIQQGTTLTSDVVYTLPTSTLLVAEDDFAVMDLGDAYSFLVNNAQAAAFDVVIALGAGMTKIGANSTLSVPPQASRIFTLIRTGALTFDLY